MDYRDYYATLGIKRDASPAEIKRAFRKLARQHHPDIKPGDRSAESKFKEINEANEVLSDPQKRSKYDLLGANWEALSKAGAGRPGLRKGLPVRAEEVVFRALLGIGEDLVGLVDLLELRLCGSVAGLDVRVVLAGQLAEGTLDLRRGGVTLDPERRVVIAIVHQSGPPG